MNRMLVVGQVPPPVGGQSLQIERLVQHSFSGIKIDLVPMRFSTTADEIGRAQWTKLITLWKLIRDIRAVARQYPGTVLYFPPAPPSFVPTVRDALLMASVRRKFRDTVIALHAAGQRDTFGRNRFTRLLARGIYGRPRLAILNTPDSLPDAIALGAREIRVIPIGISDPGPCVAKIETVDVPTVLYVGHITRDKGVVSLLAACARLRKQDAAVRLHIVGPFGPDLTESTFREVAEKLEVTSRLVISGQLVGGELAAAYRAADIFAFPSQVRSESLGLVSIEAMSHGLPVIAARWRGIEHVVVDDVTGLLHEPGDVVGMADAIRKLRDSPELRSRLGASGRERFLQRFSEGRYWRDMEDTFLSVLFAPNTVP